MPQEYASDVRIRNAPASASRVIRNQFTDALPHANPPVYGQIVRLQHSVLPVTQGYNQSNPQQPTAPPVRFHYVTNRADGYFPIDSCDMVAHAHRECVRYEYSDVCHTSTSSMISSVFFIDGFYAQYWNLSAARKNRSTLRESPSAPVWTYRVLTSSEGTPAPSTPTTYWAKRHVSIDSRRHCFGIAI